MQIAWCIWITGLPGSGKSVVAEALHRFLAQKGIQAQVLASDALRKILTPEPKYSLDERNRVYATLVYVAKLLAQNDVNVIIDATGNLERYRDSAREQIPNFMEVYLECPLKVCIEREAERKDNRLAPRKIYEKALKGEATTVPGIGQPYQRPKNPEVTIDTTKHTPEQAARKILKLIIRSHP